MKGILRKILLAMGAVMAAFAVFAALFEFEETVKAKGIVEAVDAVEIRSLSDGILTEVLCAEYDRVEPDQALAVLANSELKHEVEAARNEAARTRAALEKARANLQILKSAPHEEELKMAEEQMVQARLKKNLAEKRFQRVQALFKKEFASQEDVDEVHMQFQIAASAFEESEARRKIVKEGPRPDEIHAAESHVKEAEAAHAKAEETLRHAEERLGYADIRTPWEGTIVSLADHAGVGQMIKAGDLVAVLSRNHAKLLRLWVRESDVGKLRLDQEADIQSLMYSRRRDRCSGSVVNIRPYAESKRGQQHYEVVVRIEEQPVPLRLGSTAWADIHVGNRTILETILGHGERLGSENGDNGRQ